MGFLSIGGPGYELGLVEGFEAKQYELGEIQREKTKKYEAQLKAAAQGMGQVLEKRKNFDEQVNTFTAALKNAPSLKYKLRGLGPEDIRNLAKSALNTSNAENTGRSKFTVPELIRQVKRTPKDDLDKFKVVSPKTQKKDKKGDSTSSSGIFGNFANILSPTRAGEQQRSILKERFAEKFPNATEKELAEAINTYGQMGGSTNAIETGTPFSVGIPLSPTETVRYQEFGQQILEDLQNQAHSDINTQVPDEVKQARLATNNILQVLLKTDYYSRDEIDLLQDDLTKMFTFLKNNKNIKIDLKNIKEIKSLIKEGRFNVDTYIESLLKATPTPASASNNTTPIQVESLEENIKNKKRD
tara:strand:- start:662 stop:1732 length:1071 start_codon:yes stop_codon:yes gene_type:complete